MIFDGVGRKSLNIALRRQRKNRAI